MYLYRQVYLAVLMQKLDVYEFTWQKILQTTMRDQPKTFN